MTDDEIQNVVNGQQLKWALNAAQVALVTVALSIAIAAVMMAFVFVWKLLEMEMPDAMLWLAKCYVCVTQ